MKKLIYILVLLALMLVGIVAKAQNRDSYIRAESKQIMDSLNTVHYEQICNIYAQPFVTDSILHKLRHLQNSSYLPGRQRKSRNPRAYSRGASHSRGRDPQDHRTAGYKPGFKQSFKRLRKKRSQNTTRRIALPLTRDDPAKDWGADDSQDSSTGLGDLSPDHRHAADSSSSRAHRLAKN